MQTLVELGVVGARASRLPDPTRSAFPRYNISLDARWGALYYGYTEIPQEPSRSTSAEIEMSASTG